jgi:hypothetical protein
VVALLTGIGIGSIISALIGLLVAVSNHRQAWINALRDDLATYLRELERMHYAIGHLLGGRGTTDLEQQKEDARIAVLFVYWRIVLRLNRTEQMHIDLRQQLDELMTITNNVPDRAKIESVVDLARRVLKREWEVAKFGPLAPMAIRLKQWRSSN